MSPEDGPIPGTLWASSTVASFTEHEEFCELGSISFPTKENLHALCCHIVRGLNWSVMSHHIPPPSYLISMDVTHISGLRK